MMPLISTLCLRVLIVGPWAKSSRPAVHVSKQYTRRTEVTTNIECERVRLTEAFKSSHRGVRECATRLRFNLPKISR